MKMENISDDFDIGMRQVFILVALAKQLLNAVSLYVGGSEGKGREAVYLGIAFDLVVVGSMSSRG